MVRSRQGGDDRSVTTPQAAARAPRAATRPPRRRAAEHGEHGEHGELFRRPMITVMCPSSARVPKEYDTTPRECRRHVQGRPDGFVCVNFAPRFFSLDCGCRRSFSLSGVAVCALAAARPTSDSANRDLRQQEKARYANGLIGNSLAPRLAAQGRAHRLISQAAQPAFAVRRPNRNLILEKNHIANAAASAAPNIHKR